MTNQNDASAPGHRRRQTTVDNGILGGIYGMAFIGGVVYYIQHAPSFWGGVLGIIKAIFWPAVILYKALELLKM